MWIYTTWSTESKKYDLANQTSACDAFSVDRIVHIKRH